MKPSERILRQHCARLLHALAHRIAPPEPAPEPPTPVPRRRQNPWAEFRLHHSEIDWGRHPRAGAMTREPALVPWREAA